LDHLAPAPQRKRLKKRQLDVNDPLESKSASLAGGKASVACFSSDQVESGEFGDDEGMESESAEDESETSMSIGSGDDSYSDYFSSSISAFSYNYGFDLASGRRKPTREMEESSTKMEVVPSASAEIQIVIDIPDHILKDLDRRALEGEQERHHRTQRLHRVPLELQEVFLRSQVGETVDHPPASGVAFHVFCWPHDRVRNPQGHQNTHGAPDGYTTAPTMPRRRGSFSEASTIHDDTTMLISQGSDIQSDG
jgi:hypothetical protein